MKKFSKLFMVLALALVLVLAAKGLAVNAEGEGGSDPVTEEQGENQGNEQGENQGNEQGENQGNEQGNDNETTPVPSGSGFVLADVEFDIDTAELRVNGEYYQIVKNAQAQTNLKAANWLPAIEGRIDLSAYSKTVYVAVTDDPTDTTCAATNIVTVTFDKAVKIKGKANFDCAIPVDPADPDYHEYEMPSSLSGALTDIVNFDNTGADGYNYEWRRSANDSWHGLEDDGPDELVWAYRLLRASNGTLYVRAYKVKEGEYNFATKEIKVKIPKGAAAPTVKVDYTKNLLTIPKGAQVYVTSASGNENTHYVSFTVDSKNVVTAVAASSGAPVGLAKAAKLSVDDLVTYLGTEDGKEFTLYLRTAATAGKKYASYFVTFSEKAPAAAPTVEFEWADTKETKVKVKNAGSVAYEYDKSGKYSKVGGGIAVGTNTEFKVRVAGNKNEKTFATKAATVPVPSKTATEYTVTFVSSTSGVAAGSGGVTVKVGSTSGSETVYETEPTENKAKVEEGKTLSFKVEATKVEGYTETVTVKAGEKTLNATAEVYTTEAIKANTEITIVVTYTENKQ